MMNILQWMSSTEVQVVDTVFLFGWFKAIMNFILDIFMQIALSIISMVMSCLTISSTMFDTSLHPELSFVPEFHHIFKVIGLSILTLIASWQIFKSFYAYMGFETEESWRIAIRAIILSILIMHSKDIIIISLRYIYDGIVNLVWSLSPSTGRSLGDYISVSISGAWESMKNTPTIPGGFLVNGLLFFYLLFRLVSLCFKLAERYALNIFYAITFPVALSAEVSKSTKPYFQGWMKGFVGNLIIQLSQIMVFFAISRFWESGFVAYKDGVPVPLIGVIIAVSLIKVLDKVEEIVRDTGIGIGFASGPMTTPLDIAQTYYYRFNSVEQLLGMFGSKIVNRNSPPPPQQNVGR